MEFDDSLSTTSMGDFGEQAQDLEIPESLPMIPPPPPPPPCSLNITGWSYHPI